VHNDLENFVRMHLHKQYSLHANVTESIKELVSDPTLSHDAIQKLVDFLTSVNSDNVLLWTTLLVLDNLAGAADAVKATINVSEMNKAGVPSKVVALAT
jgi:hypothetical protein